MGLLKIFNKAKYIDLYFGQPEKIGVIDKNIATILGPHFIWRLVRWTIIVRASCKACSLLKG